MPHLILFGFLLIAFWLIRRDIALRPGLSAAVWIPTLWVGIISSRPVSAWIGFGGSSDTLDGSPVDRMFYLTMIVAGALTLARRHLNIAWIIGRGWPVFLFYGFLLVSVLWANSLEASSKRWIKEAGNIVIALVLLTEREPLHAIRAVFVRVGILLIPLSLIFIRYFPELGRQYGIHSGRMEATGVTFQKNSLGTMLMVCGIVMVWDWIERTRDPNQRQSFRERAAMVLIGAIGIWLFFLCDSKTSMLSMAVAGAIIAAIRFPAFHRRISAFGVYTVMGVVAFMVIDSYVGLVEMVVTALGRDMTFTGRTLVWKELFGVGTDPWFGTGFMSFWDDPDIKAKLPIWVAFSAHNGYIETYLAGGRIGVVFLSVMLLAVTLGINRDLRRGGNFAVVRFGVLCATFLANFAESNFACMTPLGLLFLIMAFGYASPEQYQASLASPTPTDEIPATAEAPEEHEHPFPIRPQSP